MENQEVISMPRIGETAPEFKAVTTQGTINFPSDFKGSWVILFSHPADFTPVCTSEFMTFASMEPQFAEFNCKLAPTNKGNIGIKIRLTIAITIS